MGVRSAVQLAMMCGVLAGGAMLALGAAPDAQGEASWVQDGKAGFFVSHIQYGLSHDASETGACPDGMTRGYMTSAEADADRAAFARAMTAPNGQQLCQNPEAGQPDPRFKIVTGPNVPVWGIDLDGQNSTANGRAAPGTCAHQDFRGMNGERGIDNQLFRVVGCSNNFQSTGQSNTFNEGMLVGEWGILITLAGVDDVRNDNTVDVAIAASADPAQLSPNREPLPNATYAMDQDQRYRAATRGRIVNGVLTTEPVDIRLHHVINAMRFDRVLNDGRLRLTLGADGTFEGYMSGYTPIDTIYDIQYGFRSGTDANGAPSRQRIGSSAGNARVQNHTCEGAYYALLANADGDRDPATGRCSSISTQYRIRGIPAFVVDVATQSANEALQR
jgi:hypothetical protein